MKRVRLLGASTLAVAGTALYTADSFLPWNRACRGQCLNFNLWHGTAGVEAGVAAIALLAFEASVALGRAPRFGVDPARVGAVGAGLLMFLTALKLGVDNAYLSTGAWVGLALATVIASLAFGRIHVARRRKLVN